MFCTLSARRGLLAALLVLGNAGCSGGGPDAALPSVSAEALRKLSASDPATVRASERFRSADAVRGRSLFGQCLVCHALDDVTGGRQGPTLAGIWGRRTGQVTGFAYSSALAGADFLWTTEAMEAWIAAPLRLLPGSQMSFAGLFSERDRTDLLAYMLSEPRLTGDGEAP